VRKIIDVSGFGHSGKSAVSEFLSDHEDFFSFPVNVEFELFRVSGGLLDLYYSNYYNWNLIRSRRTIQNFQELILRIGTIQRINSLPSLWKSSGHGYDQYFNNRFIELSELYIKKLIVMEQETFWPYEKLYLSQFKLLREKVKGKLFNSVLTRKVFYTDRNLFLLETSNYIHSLFNEIEDKEASNIVLNNAFDPFNPSACLEMVQNSYSIIVERDPRDIYASLLGSGARYVPAFEKDRRFDELKKKIVGAANIDEFILRFKTIKNNAEFINNPRILRLRYEDFVLLHGDSKEKIYQFLNVEQPRKKSNYKFDPENSRKNIGLWKKYSDIPEIKKISTELSEFCYQN
jgi:hypothetical protein